MPAGKHECVECAFWVKRISYRTKERPKSNTNYAKSVEFVTIRRKAPHMKTLVAGKVKHVQHEVCRSEERFHFPELRNHLEDLESKRAD